MKARLLTRLGQLLLRLRDWADVYGTMLVIRFGSEADVEPLIQAALAARRASKPTVLLVPVMTDSAGVPATTTEGSNDFLN